MEANNRARILEKIQKSLNLAKDAGATAGEAAAALNMAQKMMAKYDVSESELGAVGYGHDSVDCPIQAGKKVPVTLSELCRLMQCAFGVHAVIDRTVRVSDPSFTVRYFGQEHRTVMAAYAHDVVYKAMQKAWANELKTNQAVKGVRGARAGFEFGFITAVREKVIAVGRTEHEKEKDRAVATAYYGRELQKVKPRQMRMDGDTYAAGTAAGSEFNLHKPVNGTASNQLRIGN